MAVTLKVNGVSRSVPAEADTPLLYVLRNDFELNGAKFGCGLAQCGACTVLVDGRGHALLRHADFGGREIRDHHARGARYARQASSVAARVHRRTGSAVRLLHQRHDHVGQGIARPQSASERGRRALGARRQSLPLRHAQSHRPRTCCAPRRRTGGPDDERSLFRSAAVHGGPRRDRASPSRSILVSPRAQQAPRLPGSLQTNRKLDGWIRIDPDGSATVFTGKIELGPGHPDRARRRSRPKNSICRSRASR